MYPYSSTTLAETTEASSTESALDTIEAKVQEALTLLEQLEPEVQVIVYARLLHGLAAKLTSGVTGKALIAAKTDRAPAKTKPPAKGKTGGRASATIDMPRADSLLRQLNDATDPIEAWLRFGSNAGDVFEVLKQEPSGVLEAMIAHHNMPQGPKPKGKSREKLAEAITLRLERHFSTL